MSTHKTWDKNGYNLTAHWQEILQLPSNARNLRIVAQEATGLAWEWWRTIYNKQKLPLTENRTIEIWSTTLYPRVSETLS
ncbi:thiol-activated cytolysin C-terminal domain-containing protein [Ligilactobacillus sp. Marseille-Q7487]|uniref:thiol-activated cytolysin C-terminal domain-containing protein n=1 Tax=Ligilactobacillus sp. Marseille-Q7487 TaxID=3022128 RepID=UPI0024A98A88|nr:thiol-activated cytolysin C-terminal domain-containing protein [Ligilactobacillus sp. Marseille-Q7487]